MCAHDIVNVVRKFLGNEGLLEGGKVGYRCPRQIVVLETYTKTGDLELFLKQQ